MHTAYDAKNLKYIEQHCRCGSPDPLHSHTTPCAVHLNRILSRRPSPETKRVSVEETVDVRGNHYGHPYFHFSKTVGMLNEQGYCRRDMTTGEIHELEVDDWPRMMITDKLARSHHDRSYAENFHDIEGYAKCWRLVQDFLSIVARKLKGEDEPYVREGEA